MSEKTVSASSDEGRMAALRALAMECASKLVLALAGDACELSVCVTEGASRICVSVTPAMGVPIGLRERTPLTPCEQSIVDVLRGREDNVTTSRLLELLEEAGHLHGESTVKHALPGLVDRGILGNSRRSPRGFYLASDPRQT